MAACAPTLGCVDCCDVRPNGRRMRSMHTYICIIVVLLCIANAPDAASSEFYCIKKCNAYLRNYNTAAFTLNPGQRVFGEIRDRYLIVIHNKREYSIEAESVMYANEARIELINATIDMAVAQYNIDIIEKELRSISANRKRYIVDSPEKRGYVEGYPQIRVVIPESGHTEGYGNIARANASKPYETDQSMLIRKRNQLFERKAFLGSFIVLSKREANYIDQQIMARCSVVRAKYGY